MDIKISKDLINNIFESKDLILYYWIENSLTLQSLSKNRVNPQFFIKYFGVKIFNYYVDICKGEREIGNCPEMMAMIEFFKTKKLPLEDVFLICGGFKTALVKFLLTEKRADFETVSNLISIFELNFYGIIQRYLVMMCKDSSYCEYYKNPIVLNIVKNENTNCPKEIVDNVEIDEYDLIDLSEIEDDINSIASKITFENFKTSIIKELGVKFESYGVVISKYEQYRELGEAIKELGYFMINNYQNSTILEHLKNLSFLLECFISDLTLWKQEIKSREKVVEEHLSKSLISNTKQIICTIANRDDNSLIEFF